jgi:ABC-2 type transport system ATP-binding protein
MQPAIDIRDLRVDYGDFTAVHDLTLQVSPGEVFGLVGPNGAGKTSTFRVLASLARPTYGEVRLAGVDVLEDRENARRVIGYMPDLAPVPRDLKCGEFLRFYARANGLGNARTCAARADECLEQGHSPTSRTTGVTNFPADKLSGWSWRRRCFTVRKS